MGDEQRQIQNTGQQTGGQTGAAQGTQEAPGHKPAGDLITRSKDEELQLDRRHDTEKGKDKQDVPKQGSREGGAQKAE